MYIFLPGRVTNIALPIVTFAKIVHKTICVMLSKGNHASSLFRHWWVSLVVGLLAIVMGICCFVVPAGSFAAMTTFFIVVMMIGGIFNIGWAVANRNWNDGWGWSLARGILELLLALWLILLPMPVVATMLIYVFGFWMLFHSILGICESCSLAGVHAPGWGWLLTCSILCLICSFIFLATPAYAGIFILTYIGLSFILYGIFRIAVACEWQKINKKIGKKYGDDVEDAQIID